MSKLWPFKCLVHALAAFSVLAASSAATAGEWQICDLRIKVLAKRVEARQLEAEVLSAKTNAEAECPQPGQVLAFSPETEDYQSILPSRKWPRAGQTVGLRYRYLDGICKDRGACRIEHYSPQVR